ncbi:unnamed protein product [Toxocara canis]|uniref:Uncharacterized protein n=1 Tax=Toxocara canis TaxID=6265 RepID=A0A183TWT0_TOXCA|nr:unnamed protein product [Toxocara canis]
MDDDKRQPGEYWPEASSKRREATLHLSSISLGLSERECRDCEMCVCVYVANALIAQRGDQPVLGASCRH